MGKEIISREAALALGLKNYFTGIVCQSGHLAERYVKCSKCIECVRFRHKKYYSANTEESRAKSKEWRSLNSERISVLSRKRRRTADGWLYLNLIAAKKRAKAKGFDFDISPDDLTMPEVCPYFGMKFIIGDRNWRPSLDRIDPSKGYVRGNVQVISMKANRMKSDGTLDDLIMMGRVASLQKENLGIGVTVAA